MISLSNLAAFSEASRIRPGGSTPPVQPVSSRAAQEPREPQRALSIVPPQPARPLPRGSLLDLKV